MHEMKRTRQTRYLSYRCGIGRCRRDEVGMHGMVGADAIDGVREIWLC
jgi:hypothetical protein